MKIMEALYTRADYNLLPEEFPAQLIEGELVKEPAPLYGHQRSSARIRRRLVDLRGPDLVPDTPADVGIDEHNVFQPDILVLRKAPALDATDVGIPCLAVEILSPSTEKRDRQVKAVRMLEAGVSEVWLVDWLQGVIEVHTARGHQRFAGRERAESEVVDGFSLVPDELFGETA